MGRWRGSLRVMGALQSCGMAVVVAGVLFLAAGTISVPAFWAYILLWLASRLAAIFAADPGLIRERARPGGRFAPQTLLAMAFPLAQLIIAGLDVGRLHASDMVPTALQVAGGIGFAAAGLLAAAAISANRFFSSMARVQEERGHTTIAAGPYRWVRHPGYSSALLLCASAGALLGSWLSYLPALIFAGLVVQRLVREERMLAARLPGYADYLGRVRWRVVPGVW
jgi:protein-S-isoprenylcysteine O-methyltransferase Ste14